MKRIILITMLITSLLFSADEWSGYQEITSDYIVGSGELLYIHPGTTIRFAHDSRLVIDGGRLDARGTETDPIRFTSLEPTVSGNDYWQGIEFYYSNNGKDSSYMKYCIVDNIDKTTQKASMEGSISAISSLLSISYCEIQNNKAYRGGGLNFNSCGVHLYENNIIKNDAQYEGGGIYINNNDDNELFETIIEKNLIKDNIVSIAGSTQKGGGGIAVVDPLIYTNIVQITENDIINNSVYSDGTLSGAGGGIHVFAAESMELQIIGNKTMYNQAFNAGGGWIQCSELQDFNLKNFVFSNNIISNNSGFNYGGFYFNTGKVKNPDELKFFNNNFVNNLNTGGKTGGGGLSIVHNGNYFEIKNSIFWENMKSGVYSEIFTEPYVYEGNFVFYSNSTSYIEGQGNTNISANSVFNRPVVGIGATPYVDYLRGNYHLSLESPCVDKGEPEMSYYPEWVLPEPDGTPPNIGAWGLTFEYTTSKYEPIEYTKPISLTVEQGQVILIDCSRYGEQVAFQDVVIQDGGQLFLKPNDIGVISIDYLEVAGQKIGDAYTTRFEKLISAEQSGKFDHYELDVKRMNCSGVDFSDMSVTISSDMPSTLNDSRIYIKNNDLEITDESGINIMLSTDFNISNNVISNFDIGITSPSIQGKASKIGRITNNTITFDVDASKAGQAKKGISVDETTVDIEDNEIINPDEGIEASKSSGRITNNTVTFDADASKQSNGKKGIFVYDGSNMEVSGNLITSIDTASPIISGIEIENSSVIASYNVIDFTEYDSKIGTYYGFYTTGLGTNSQFINNTINNATYGFYNIGSASPTDYINNIAWGNVGDVYSDSKILIAYNNNSYGTISEQALIESKDNFKDDPVYKSVKISDFYLDGSSKSIDAGLFIEGFHELGVNYYGDKPDVGAIEYYVALITDLDSPANVSISTSGTVATISWNSVTNANSYKIYSSEDPYGTFDFVKSTGSLNWSASVSTGTKLFYYVIASTDAAKDIDEEIIPDKRSMKIVKPKKKIRINVNELSNR